MKSSGNQEIEKNDCDNNKTPKVSQNPINQNEAYDETSKINKFSQTALKELEKPKHHSNLNSKSDNNEAIQKHEKDSGGRSKN